MTFKTKNAWFLACAAIMLLFCAQAFAGSIVDYYNKLSDAQLKGQKYTLILKGGKWAIKDRPDYGHMDDPVVDVRNGYIRTVYHGGDGDDERVITLFIKTDKTPVIGITRYYSGTGGDYGYDFYEYREGGWKNVTAGIFPKISYRAFLAESFDAKPFEQLMRRVNKEFNCVEPQFVLALPRTGTTVKASLFMKALRTEQVTDIDMKIVDTARANIKYREMNFTWNMLKGVFEQGEKK